MPRYSLAPLQNSRLQKHLVRLCAGPEEGSQSEADCCRTGSTPVVEGIGERTQIRTDLLLTHWRYMAVS